MEHECADKAELFPSPERLDKVKDSMENLETVVRERNKAYHLLETGETGERPSELVVNQLGLNARHRFFSPKIIELFIFYFVYFRCKEYLIPKEVNSAWKNKHQYNPKGNAVSKFLLMYREKLYNEKRKSRKYV